MSQKRNEEYWALKERIDRWGVWLGFGPLWTVFPLTILGAIAAGRLFQAPFLGAFIGFVGGGALLFYLIKTRLGFVVESEETCQCCSLPMARSRGGGFPQLDYLCRRCGNNNSLEFEGATESTKPYTPKKFPDAGNAFTLMKDQTYAKASNRISRATKLHFRVLSPVILIAMLVFVYQFTVHGETENTFKFFFILWCFILVANTIFFVATRDVIPSIFNGLYNLPRMFLGPKYSRNPFEHSVENLPHYLRCNSCGAAAITQLRLSWEGLDICPNCGNDNRIDLHDT